MKNETYVVHVEIRSGEYEKSSIKLVTASSDEEANKNALLSECHNSIGDGAEWTDTGISDVGFEFHYSVSSCKKVEHEHIDIVRSYFGHY